MMTDRDRWQRLESIFQDALELEPEARAAHLDLACGADTELRAELDDMLAAEAPERALAIERLVVEHVTPTTDPLIGMRFGAWRVVGLLGHGGMGSVYLAERADGQYEQQVALKLVRTSGPGGPLASRFALERHLLARLSHPNIARLLDAGVTPEGSAYLVMEYVNGEPVTAACDTRRATVRERLRLFRVVCDATQHAHQALIVHRDLKPSNIFVSHIGEVKLLDFGIAKLLEADHGLSDPTTRDARALTPAYAAPEQLRGEPVTTAADVYVLGAVLYEIVAGVRPNDSPSSREGYDIGAGEQIVPPSVAVRRQAASHDAEERERIRVVAAARQTTPVRLARYLEGDIDRVVLKAMSAEADRRYASAGQLAEDIGRILDGFPVVARPDSLAYRARRFVGRHRLSLAVAAAFTIALTAFAVVAVLQAREVARERDRARVQAARAERVSTLLADLFKLAEPGAAQGEQISARELVDQGTSRIASELAEDPETQAALFNVVGRVYGNLAMHDRAVEVLERALAIERGAQTGNALTQAETLHRLGELHILRNDYAAAEQRLREALTLRRGHAAAPAAVAETLEALGRALSFTNAADTAEPLLEEAVVLRRQLIDTAPGELMSALHELGLARHRKGDLRRAEADLRESVDVGRRLAQPVPAKVEGLLYLARLIHQFDREPAKAEPVYREALAMARAIYPSDHQQIATCLGELARDVRDQGRLVEAETVAREAVAMQRRLYGDRHREVMIGTQTLASILREQGRLEEAEPLLRDALATAQPLFGRAHPMTFGAQRSLASLLEARGRLDEAFELRQAELDTVLASLGDGDVYAAIALAGLGEHCLVAGRSSDAEGYFRRALAVRQRLHPENHWRIDDARVALATALIRTHQLDEAESLLTGAHDRLRVARGPTSEETALARRALTDLSERRGRPTDAARGSRPPR